MKEEIKGITYFEEDREPTPDNPNNIISIGVDERVANYIDRLERKLEDKEKEIERLNNIINELEKWCLSWKENDKYCYLASNDKDKCRYDIWEEVLDKLQELKGSDKSGN